MTAIRKQISWLVVDARTGQLHGFVGAAKASIAGARRPSRPTTCSVCAVQLHVAVHFAYRRRRL